MSSSIEKCYDCGGKMIVREEDCCFCDEGEPCGLCNDGKIRVVGCLNPECVLYIDVEEGER